MKTPKFIKDLKIAESIFTILILALIYGLFFEGKKMLDFAINTFWVVVFLIYQGRFFILILSVILLIWWGIESIIKDSVKESMDKEEE